MNIHAVEHGAEEIRKHVKVYVLVFVALMFLTVVTVIVSYLHLSTPVAIAVALFIASIKGGLVACYFMHLVSERKVIYWVLLLTVIFFLVLLFLPLITDLEGSGIRHVA